MRTVREHDIGRDTVRECGGENPGKPVVGDGEDDKGDQPYAESADPEDEQAPQQAY